MQRFLDWFNRRGEPEGLLRAATAHLWFVTVHPFEDGNGRIARAIADQALAQSEGSGQRFYSMSSQIRKERSDYYAILERTQKGGLGKCSIPTAPRDINELIERGVLRRDPGGSKNTSHTIASAESDGSKP